MARRSQIDLGMNNSNLSNIVARQNQSRIRDLVFVAAVALAAVFGVSGVKMAASNASTRTSVAAVSQPVVSSTAIAQR